MPRAVCATPFDFLQRKLEWASQSKLYSTLPDSPESRPAELNELHLCLPFLLPNLRFRSAAKDRYIEFARELWAIAGSRRVAAEVAEDVACRGLDR